jgi:hypothetical protein
MIFQGLEKHGAAGILRADFPKEVPGPLNLVENLGFKEVELAGTRGLKPEEFKKMLAAPGSTGEDPAFLSGQHGEQPRAVMEIPS